MHSVSYGERVRDDAEMVKTVLATRFLRAKRAELRAMLNIDSSRLYRALLYLERKGILVAEYRGWLSLSERLYDLRK